MKRSSVGRNSVTVLRLSHWEKMWDIVYGANVLHIKKSVLGGHSAFGL